METTRSLFPLEPSGGPVVPGRSSASSGSSAKEEELFQREVDRATERAGGRAAVEERAAEHRQARRQRRREGFADHQEQRGAERPDRGAPEGDPAAARRELSEAAEQGPRLQAPAADDAAPPGIEGPRHRPAPDDPVLRAPSGTAAAPAGSVLAAPVLSGRGAAAPAAVAAPAAGPAPAGSPVPAPLTPPAGLQGPVEAARPTRAPHTPPPAATPDPEPHQAADVLRQIRVHLAGGAREAILHLSPAELGRLQVRLTLREGRLAAVVRGESPEALELLGRHLPELRATFAEQGIEVADFQLELGLENEPDSGFASPEGRRGQGGTLGPREVALERTVALPLSPSIQDAALDGGIDTFA